MKIRLLLVFCLLCTIKLFSQDIIVKADGDSLIVIVNEINDEQVIYYRFDNKEGPIYKLNKSEVRKIKFNNGTEEVFKIKPAIVSNCKLNQPTQPEQNFEYVDSVTLRGEKYIRAKIVDALSDPIRYYDIDNPLELVKCSRKKVNYSIKNGWNNYAAKNNLTQYDDAFDLLVLKMDVKRIQAKVINYQNDTVYFYNAANPETLVQLPKDNITFQNPSGLNSYINSAKTAKTLKNTYPTVNQDYSTIYQKGKFDAEHYHGKAGGLFFCGVLFGPFAVIGAAVCEPTPYTGINTLAQSQNRDLFGNPTYLTSYKKTARSKLVGAAFVGWISWAVIYLILSR